jgi:murein DD-endopeptidase MepM/ murein hydrolase activator NlpD
MENSRLPISTEGENHTATAAVCDASATGADPSCSRPFLLRFVAWCVTGVWRTCVDWRTKRPFLTRATAHVSMVVLAVATVFLGGVGISLPRIAVGESIGAGGASFPLAVSLPDSGRMLASVPYSSRGWALSPNSDTISRLPIPHTSFPEQERERTGVTTYIVRPGDTVYGIAAQFNLSAETIVWSNREALMDAPWLIKPGLELSILPADGVYHTTLAGETVADIAAQYEVDPAVVYNVWNDLEEDEQPVEGQLLVVPGGTGDEVEWDPPPIVPMPGPAGLVYGSCGGVAYSGPGANGWFILPTGSREVSGWYFHDPRNPTHIGLDYRCRTGDPIVAADSGLVTIAGWNGGYGIMAQVDHGNGFVTRYGHFSSIAVGCGQAVNQGDLLGYCGSTGWSTGAHLHFEIRLNNIPQDPLLYQ